MDDIEAVHVVDGDGHLREDRQRIVLLERPLGQQLLKQLAAAEALLDDVHALGVADDLVEVDDVRVLELLQDLDLHAQGVEELVVLELLGVQHLRRAAGVRITAEGRCKRMRRTRRACRRDVQRSLPMHPRPICPPADRTD